MNKLSLALLLGLTCSPAIAEDTLTVIIEGVKTGSGKVLLALFDKPDNFPNGEFLRGEIAPADADGVPIEINDLAHGEYAITVYQDVNDNGELDKNFLGIPREPYGFSGGWKSGAAKFEEALFEFGPGSETITIKMR